MNEDPYDQEMRGLFWSMALVALVELLAVGVIVYTLTDWRS